MEKPGGSRGEMGEHGGWIDHEIEKNRAERAQTSAELRALHEEAERVLLSPRVETAVKAVKLAETQGALGLPVDVLTTSSRDPVSEKLFETTYERLGLSGARRDAERREILGGDGEVLGEAYHVLDRDDLSISEVQHDDPVSGDLYRTLYVKRPGGL
jgi:hypothetical protein